MVEYNQCQATLKTLYEIGLPGNVEEFTAYRILMLLHGRNRSGKPLDDDNIVRLTSFPRTESFRRSTNPSTEIQFFRSSCA